MTIGYPRITIVTPSYNQGEFIEETILSVIGQGYPNLEYLIFDGGSTDDSVEIIKKYDRHITHWVSEKDGGQSNAINKAFSKATGQIVGWINSDDYYLPGVFNWVSKAIDPSRPEIIFGNCYYFIEGSPRLWGSDVEYWSKIYDLRLYDYVIQPGSFWTKQVLDIVGPFDETLHFSFDWDWFIRAKLASVSMKPIPKYLASFRFHASHKSSTGGDRRLHELGTIYSRYAGDEYANALMALEANSTKVSNLENWMHRLHFGRASTYLFKLRHPRLFRNISIKEVRSILRMLPRQS